MSVCGRSSTAVFENRADFDSIVRQFSSNRFSARDAEIYCRQLARRHYENFPLVSWLLPKRLHQHFYNLYAYCRWADDLADETGNVELSRRLLGWWRTQLHDCFAGRATHPVFVALRETIHEFAIPAAPFEDLLSAFEQDQEVFEYDTFNELLDYCRRSANPVGRLVLFVCRISDRDCLAWSDSICTGLQLANFWQDVRRDWEQHRIYLPREDMVRFGYSRADLEHGTMNSAFRSLMQFEVDRARRYLEAGLPLVDRLPGRLQVDVDLFARGGLQILKQIEAIDYQVLKNRPTVRPSDFARLFVRCVLRRCARSIGF